MIYTVEDNQGRVVEFEWTGTEPPTDTDMEEVFAAIPQQSTQREYPPAGASFKPSGEVLTPEQRQTDPLLVGIGKGLTDIGIGARQRLAGAGEYLGVTSPETSERLRQEAIESERVFAPLKEESGLARAGEIVGQTAPLLTVPGGVAGGTLARAGTAAVAGGFTGFIQPTTEEGQVAENVAKGAAFGAGASLGLSFAGKLFNTLFRRLPKNEVQQLSERYGIRTTTGEVTGNPHIQKAETWLESVPVVGLKGFRQKQQAEAQAVAKNLLSKYVAPTQDDLTDIYNAMGHNSEYVDSLYDTFKGLLRDAPEKITPSQTKLAAKELIKRYPDIFKRFQDTKREALIKNVLASTKDIKKVSPILSSTGEPFKQTVKREIDFNDIWELRKSIGSMIGQARKQLVSGKVDKTQLSELSRLYGAVNDDIDDWITKIGKPEIKDALVTANDAYKQFIVKYDALDDIFAKAEGITGAGELFSPKKLSTQLKNLAWKQKKLKVFEPKEIDEMVGIANIMQVVKRAGQFAENPPTGNRWGLPVVALMGDLKTAAYLPIASFLTKSSAGKRLALSASKIDPKSRMMGMIIRQIYRQLPKITATYGTDGNAPEVKKEKFEIPNKNLRIADNGDVNG